MGLRLQGGGPGGLCAAQAAGALLVAGPALWLIPTLTLVITAVLLLRPSATTISKLLRNKGLLLRTWKFHSMPGTTPRGWRERVVGLGSA